MLLTELIYLAVKNVIYYDDDSFTLDSFRKGNWRNSADYGNQINNILTPINEAISRLQDLERIPYKIGEISEITNKIIDYKDFDDKGDCREVVGVGQLNSNGEPNVIEFLRFGAKSIVIKPNILSLSPLYIEYKPSIYFNSFSGQYFKYDENEDKDLYEAYGITDAICQYIIEYAEGKLLEQISPNEANMHISRSEAYFNGLTPYKKTFTQRVVEHVYSIGD